MSNLFTRLKDSISADLNDMLDQKRTKKPDCDAQSTFAQL
ncbi:hypothetical protein NBRC111894_2539 [Sporolactobacillus inulinus]|uniref:Uncharacterized protein n=1 Tax=Sporolactobacillus inulinus TaxID=2078 RepID=A0A4Y1ZD39_9BACL|nr:hypothetical protein NBRC111894_2539 [Sporolactobacillus inulinus]